MSRDAHLGDKSKTWNTVITIKVKIVVTSGKGRNSCDLDGVGYGGSWED